MLQRFFFSVTFTLLISFSLAAQVPYETGGPRTPEMGPHSDPFNRQSLVLSGTVQNMDGTPAKDAQVEVRMFGTGNTIASGYASGNGHFEFSELPAGDYEVVAEAGLASVSQRVTLADADPNVVLRLPQANASQGDGTRGAVSVAQMKVPEHARKLFHKAQDALQKEKLDEAQKYLSQALADYPQYAAAMTLQGILKLDQHDYPGAEETLSQALKYDSSYPLAYIALGATYNMMTRWDDAIQSLDRGLGLDPTAWQGYFELGKSFIGKADYPSALKNLARAEDLAPKYSTIHLLKAHAMLAMKDYSDAMMELESYLQREPSGPQSEQAKQMLGQVKAFMASNH